MAIFTILYGNYYPPHGEFKLICIGKFARRTWVNFTQQYGKNRRRCQQNKFYYVVWQLLLYYYREFPSKILSVWSVSSAGQPAPTYPAIHTKNGIWIIYGRTRRIAVCSSTFYGVNSNFCCHTVKCIGPHCNFSGANMNYPNAVFFV